MKAPLARSLFAATAATAAAAVALPGCGNVRMPDDDPLDPTIPHVTASTDGSDAITISWTEVVGAVGYQLRRGESPDGPFVLLADAPATVYADLGLPHADVKYYQVTSCDAAGACDGVSSVARGYTLPGSVHLDGCTRGSSTGSIACAWQPSDADAVTDGELSYELRVRAGDAAPIAIGTSVDITGEGAVSPGQLYQVSVAVVSSETGPGPSSNEEPGYAESVAIAYDDGDPADTGRAVALAALLAADPTATGEAAGAMPELPVVLVPLSSIVAAADLDFAWAGLPMILSPGFAAAAGTGQLRNVTSTSRAVIAMGPSVAVYDTINALGGDWGPGSSPAGLSAYSEFGGYTDAVVLYDDGDVFTSPLYATGYGASPPDGTAMTYADEPTTITALYRDGAGAVARLCRIDASIVEWYGCAQEGGWGWFGFLDPPTTAAGHVLLVDFVARFTAL